MIIVKYARKFNCYCQWCDKLQLPVCCGGRRKGASGQKKLGDGEESNEKVEAKTKNKKSNRNKNKIGMELEKIDEDFDEDKVSENEFEIDSINDDQLDAAIVKKDKTRVV